MSITTYKPNHVSKTAVLIITHQSFNDLRIKISVIVSKKQDLVEYSNTGIYGLNVQMFIYITMLFVWFNQ